MAARARTGPSFIDTLAELHALDPDEVGLGSFGKRDSYVGRQLHRWYASWNASKDREIPDVDRLHDFLVASLPEQTRVSVVHGDYGLHNCRVAAEGHIAAVVDWEIATLGDPLADLAYCINAWLETPDGRLAATRPARPRCPASPAARSSSAATRSAPTPTSARSSTTPASTTGRRSASSKGSTPGTSTGRRTPRASSSALFPQRMDRSLQLAVEAAERLGR